MFKNLIKKALHGLAPAAGAAIAVATGLFGAGVPALVVVKAAVGAFIAYIVKPARPADPPAAK